MHTGLKDQKAIQALATQDHPVRSASRAISAKGVWTVDLAYRARRVHQAQRVTTVHLALLETQVKWDVLVHLDHQDLTACRGRRFSYTPNTVKAQG